ncbi:uncharacterized protein LOC111700527 [Eurytemora carolleeae]|uniref:uncharacterized protein LOC111700527 n=1 Tax=Eurytemora carolleeae TaxID=1294199 RepID=UPI000C76F36C|nr:uncharacterized protein LOC111700527 [Eurytemora carolleeae]XP_023327233.1 uncharacterized protein LOC111700527 [Eurytemora carolleeae]|eukprot:XP_023327232.1 uncharacterized protein LOC111700527 [Eurytemora affinis]
MKLYLILVTLLDLFFSSSKAKQYLVETKDENPEEDVKQPENQVPFGTGEPGADYSLKWGNGDSKQRKIKKKGKLELWTGYWVQPLVAVSEKYYFSFNKTPGEWSGKGSMYPLGDIAITSLPPKPGFYPQFSLEFLSARMHCKDMTFNVNDETSKTASGNLTYQECIYNDGYKLKNDHGTWNMQMKTQTKM